MTAKKAEFDEINTQIALQEQELREIKAKRVAMSLETEEFSAQLRVALMADDTSTPTDLAAVPSLSKRGRGRPKKRRKTSQKAAKTPPVLPVAEEYPV